MDAVRLVIAAVVVVALIFAGSFVFDPARGQDPAEAVRTALQTATNSADLTQRVEAALQRGDYDDAAMYADIAQFAGMPLTSEAETRLKEEGTHAREIARGAGGFVEGFVTGEATSTTALAGAVASDLTVIGDLRDITSEGTKLLKGESYNELILSLSVVGVALTTATVASGGGALPAKIGVSVLKVAKRSGTLTADFAKYLGRLTQKAVDTAALRATLRETKITDTAATRAAVSAYARGVRTAEIFPTLAKLEAMRNAAGAGETVRLLKFVRTSEELDDVAKMTKVLGPKTRGIMELTGKTSLRLFKHGLNVAAILFENILAFLAWAGSFLTVLFTRRLYRLVGA